MKYFSNVCAVMIVSLFVTKINAQLRLPAIISSGMVLQQNDSAMLWGWASPGAKVHVTTGWNNRTDSTTATSGASWKLEVATPAAGGPYNIEIRSDRSVTLKDVMIGEVWIASGQSNMEWNYNWGEKDMASELGNPRNNNIRFFHVPKTTSAFPQDDVKAEWKVCDSTTMKSFSSVAYFFGKKISAELNVPVGLINASWGGTPAEVWTPVEKIHHDTALFNGAGKVNKTSLGWPWQPGSAFNAMIAPLTNFNISGAIWYQGESNVGSYSTYKNLMTTLIDSWRESWKEEIPFYYVQIAPFNYGDSNINGALLQEAQTKTLDHPNVGMAVITDLVDSVTDIHPSHKREVGNRLANWALAQTYRKEGITFKSPMFEKAEKNGNKVNLTFTGAANGLKSAQKKVVGFMISDASGQWYPADAKISGSTITVWHKKIKDPAEVRYAFTNTLIGNVFSTEGLPLTPFRTGQL